MRGRDFAQWQTFDIVAELGSFSRAAEQLGMSASSVSRVVRDLEARVGLRLLNRTTRSVSTTEAGARMRERLQRVFAEFESMDDDAGRLRDAPVGTVRLLVPRLAYGDFIEPRLAGFLARHPGIVLDVNVDDAVSDLTAGGYDLGIRLGERLEDDIVAFPLGGKLRQIAAATPAYLAAHGVPRHPRDLHRHRCINWRQPGTLGVYPWEFARRGRQLAVMVQGPLVLNDRGLCLNAALQDLGVTFWVEHRLAPHIAAGRLQAVLEDWSPAFAGFHVCYPRQRHMASSLRALIDYLKETAAA